MQRHARVFFALLALAMFHAAPARAQEAFTVVGKAYCAQKVGVSVRDVLGDGPRLKIASVMMRIGDKVTAKTRLIGYEAMLEQVIQEKMKLSRHTVASNESLLQTALVELKKIKDANREVKLMRERGAASPLDVQLSNDQVSLMEKRIEYLRTVVQSEQAKVEQRQEKAVSDFGADVENKKFPKNFFEEAGIDGYILYVNPKLLPGAVFTRADTDMLYEIGTLENIVVRCAVHEIQALRLKPGEPVDIVFRAFPEKTFQSEIRAISIVSIPSYLQQPSFYEVEIPLDNPDLRIKDGMRCDVTFHPAS
ncbi:efflux RND transporter periplasmic adaptor subunit [Desulfolutivibrio sulfoxidireducens]|uniref:efflux RND transporter periplasmic adaptor subunit n=1 Tax=Desulfolutivibrio sulfoxidireducens TaxID=2773299 RepID=UPI000B14FC7C|nr:efflux RND transporter periplasmic adaptor subunit [Desulfolutivibrio sulfoxidireducens]